MARQRLGVACPAFGAVVVEYGVLEALNLGRVGGMLGRLDGQVVV